MSLKQHLIIIFLDFKITCFFSLHMVQVLVVRVDIEVVTYEAMTSQCGRSMVQILDVRVDIGVVIYEAMTPQ